VKYGNIQNGGQDSSRREVRRAAEIMGDKMWGRVPDFIFLNEIQEIDDKEDVRTSIGEHFQPAHLIQTPNPIFRRRVRWSEKGRARVMLSPVFPGENPERWLTLLTAGSRRPWGPDIDNVCIHFTNGAFNNEHYRTKTQRRERWVKEDHGTANVVEQRTSLGRPMIMAGDFNRVHLNRYHPEMKWAITHGITRIGSIPSDKWEINAINADTFWIPSDKPGLAALLEFKRRR
jgi:hypothetical protein